jgi:hypothetical protein
VRLDELKIDDFPDVEGLSVYASDGDRIGRIWAIVSDEGSREPELISISTGLFGRKRLFVPVQGARLDDDGVDVAYTKEEIKNSPDVDPTVDQADAEALFGYYAELDPKERVETTLLKRAATPSTETVEVEPVAARAETAGGEEPSVAGRDARVLFEHEEHITARRPMAAADTLGHTDLVGELVERTLEQGEIERISVDGEDSGEVEILPDGSVSIPLLEEQVVMTKRVLVRERIIVRKKTVTQTRPDKEKGRGEQNPEG